MNRRADPYRAAFVAGARRALGQPGDLGVRIMFYLIVLVVLGALWEAAIGERGRPVAGYDFRAVLWYLVAAEASVIATRPRMIEDIGNDIAGGAIATEMLRPVTVVLFRIASETGEAMVRLALAVVVGCTLASVLVGAPPEPAAALPAIPATVLAVACNVAAQHAFAGAAFWLRDAKAAWFLYQKLIFLLGGMLLPLELLPDTLARVARVLPFWTMSYAPARLLSGHAELALLVGQALWLTILTGGALAVFARGERRLQAVGG